MTSTFERNLQQFSFIGIQIKSIYSDIVFYWSLVSYRSSRQDIVNIWLHKWPHRLYTVSFLLGKCLFKVINKNIWLFFWILWWISGFGKWHTSSTCVRLLLLVCTWFWTCVRRHAHFSYAHFFPKIWNFSKFFWFL